MVDARTERRERLAGEMDHLERARFGAGCGARCEPPRPDRGLRARGTRGAGPRPPRWRPRARRAGPGQRQGCADHRSPNARRDRCRRRATRDDPAPRCRATARGPTWYGRPTSSAGSATSTRWWTTTERSHSLGFAVPMSIPRYTCIESSDTISTSPSSRARANASADFPDAVGPTSARWVMPRALLTPPSRGCGGAAAGPVGPDRRCARATSAGRRG